MILGPIPQRWSAGSVAHKEALLHICACDQSPATARRRPTDYHPVVEISDVRIPHSRLGLAERVLHVRRGEDVERDVERGSNIRNLVLEPLCLVPFVTCWISMRKLLRQCTLVREQHDGKAATSERD